ncbi:MAG: FecR domain-containing protein [Micavibrio aeruginosavorus]|uniref:FecR domain-containing protein n=1 Tax=Micavibrio aeruginosavorus TaxID=349221 RepID=A0A7T5R434_9BACT|nr:MAG: FecR domain-containing protein [Micavibrio aeruginosavorus]
MTRRLFAIFTLILLIALPAQAQTATDSNALPAAIVGSVLEVEGTVTITPKGGIAKAAKVNDQVNLNDSIETGPGSRAFILLIDDTELTVGDDALLTIDEYYFDEKDNSANKGVYSILRGAFLYTSGLVAKKENPDVTVNTPYAAIGIRGTSFWGGVVDDEYGVLVTEGRVTVQTERGRIYVDKGQGTFLRSRTSIPSRAATWSPEKTDRAVQTIALKKADAVRERIKAHGEFQKQARLKHRDMMIERRQQLQQSRDPNAPIRRIDNAPRLPQKPDSAEPHTPQRPAIEKPEIEKPVSPLPEKAKPPVLDDTAPEESKSLKEGLNAPIDPDKPALTDKKADPLLKAAPTRSELGQVAPAQEKEDTASTAQRPKVELPVMGQNEAHTNELKEQQHLQQRRQPVIRQNLQQRQQQQRAPRPSKAAGAL